MASSSAFERFESLKRRLMKDTRVRALERLTSPDTHPGLRPGLLLLKLLRILVTYFARRVTQGWSVRRALKSLRKLEGSAFGVDVLVIGGGPSASSLNEKEVARRQSEGTLIVVATNYFLSTELAKEISPDYLVWSDEVFHPRNRHKKDAWADPEFFHKNREYGEPWELLQGRPETTLVSPFTWLKDLENSELRNRVVYFNDESLEGWSRNISPLKARGYHGSTGVKAIAFALFLKPNSCFIIGVDLSNFTSFSVDLENRLIRKPQHIAGADSGTLDISSYASSGIADVIYAAASELLVIKKLFPADKVVNLGLSSLVDAFPRRASHELLKKNSTEQ